MGKCKIIFLIEIVEVENCIAIRNSWFLGLFSATSRCHFYLIFWDGGGKLQQGSFYFDRKNNEIHSHSSFRFFSLYN